MELLQFHVHTYLWLTCTVDACSDCDQGCLHGLQDGATLRSFYNDRVMDLPLSNVAVPIEIQYSSLITWHVK